MSSIRSITGKQHYRTEVHSSRHELIADEPESNGGKGEGFSPHELLASALASCTGITLRMYADRKQWDLESIAVDVTVTKDESGLHNVFKRAISFKGQLNAEEQQRLLQIANQCPVHKLLEKPSIIQTTLENAS